MIADATKLANRSISLRTADNPDRAFLFRVYASTRLEELATVNWTEAERESFLRMQFEAQDRFYRENYPGAEFQMIIVDGQPAGRLYLHRDSTEVRVIDIALLPEYRRQGIGTSLLCDVLREGALAHKTVTIHVEVFNPAHRLYERLGFRKVANHGLYDLMAAGAADPTGA